MPSKKPFTFTQETIDRALSEFDLVNNAGTEANRTACAMTLLTWMCGRRWDRRKKEWVKDGPTKNWTDQPECASSVVASLTIRANDHTDTTKEMRRELVKLGVKGALDTWWLPGIIIAKGQELATPAEREEGEDPQDVYLRAKRLLKYITWWKQNGRPLPVLTDADLTNADLMDAVLTRADLTRAVLTRAVLTRAVLTDADLTNAVLTDAVLTDADLTNADLTDAVLTRAVLTRAVLTRAVLTDAVLTDAVLYGAYFCGARGRPVWGAPPGWRINESGIWLRDNS
jgi:hypothetical protein